MPISPIRHREVVPSRVAADAALALLARHQERRRQHVPTLTVLAGRNDLPAQLVRSWADDQKRAVGETSSTEIAEAISCWFAVLLESQNVTAAAYAWLAERGDYDASALSFGLQTRSPHEQTLFLDRVLGTRSVAPVDAVCRAVVEHACQNGSTMRGLWNRLLNACAGDLFRATTGMLSLVGDQQTPILHVVARTTDVVSLHTVTTDMASLVSVAPALAVIVSAETESLDEYLATTPESRSVAMVREGLIWLADGEESAPTDRGSIGAAESVSVGPGEAGRGIAPATVKEGGHLLGRNSHLQSADTRANDDPARSAAERYLYERLQAHPETAGLFELNGYLEHAGSRALEVDLLARGAQVAVEIDGYYHFTDLGAYRRDRQKDLLLQHAGYFVVRCLADDVASRLEEILESIISAVRRPPPGQGRAGEGRGRYT